VLLVSPPPVRQGLVPLVLAEVIFAQDEADQGRPLPSRSIGWAFASPFVQERLLLFQRGQNPLPEGRTFPDAEQVPARVRELVEDCPVPRLLVGQLLPEGVRLQRPPGRAPLISLFGGGGSQPVA